MLEIPDLKTSDGDTDTPQASLDRIVSLNAGSWASTSAVGSDSAYPNSCACLNASANVAPDSSIDVRI